MFPKKSPGRGVQSPKRGPPSQPTTTTSKAPAKSGAGRMTSTTSACSCYEICQFPEPPIGDYRCPLDGGVLRDAVRSRKCMHTFGMQCVLTYLLKEKEACPVCGVPMDCSDLEPAERLRSEIQALPYSCRELDCCNWVGMVCEEADHANGPDCGLQLVRCPFCDRHLRAGEEFDEHKGSCPEAIIICPECYEDMPRKELPMHKKGLGGRTCQVSEPMRRQKDAERKRTAEQEAAKREARVLEAHREREEQRALERTDRKKRREEDPNYLSFYSQHPNASIYQSSVMHNNRSSMISPEVSIARSATRSLDSELRGASFERPSICHEDGEVVTSSVSYGAASFCDSPATYSVPAPKISRGLTPTRSRTNVSSSVRSSSGKKIVLSPISKQHPSSASGIRSPSDPIPKGYTTHASNVERAFSAPLDSTATRIGQQGVMPLSPTTLVQDARYDSYFDGPRHVDEDNSHFRSGTSGFSSVGAPNDALSTLVSVIDELRADRVRDREVIEGLKVAILEMEEKHSELELRHFKLQSTVSEIVDVIATQEGQQKSSATEAQSSATSASISQAPTVVPTTEPQTTKREPSPPSSAPTVSVRGDALKLEEEPNTVPPVRKLSPPMVISSGPPPPPTTTSIPPTRTAASVEQPTTSAAPTSAAPSRPVEGLPIPSPLVSSSCVTSPPTAVTGPSTSAPVSASSSALPPSKSTTNGVSTPRAAPKQIFTQSSPIKSSASNNPTTTKDALTPRGAAARPTSRPSSQVVTRKGSVPAVGAVPGGHQAALDFVFSGMKKPEPKVTSSSSTSSSIRREPVASQPPVAPAAVGSSKPPTVTTHSAAARASKGKESANPRIRRAALSAATPERDGGGLIPTTSAAMPPSPVSSPSKRVDVKYTHRMNVGGKTPIGKPTNK